MAGIRNIAIIAHVDHGKTTLVDSIIHQTNTLDEREEKGELILDNIDQERERGITIKAKNISVQYKGVKINIIDTPGHSDFGGEVERTLQMADSVLLLVDAFEGPMPQTRFVLAKSLELGLKPIVVINKIDKPQCRPDWVVDQVFDLFVDLQATDDQLEFPILYAVGRDGWAIHELEDKSDNLNALMDTIIEKVPEPVVREGPLQIQIKSLDYSSFVGRIAVGRVHRGTIKVNQSVRILKANGKEKNINVKELFLFVGLGRVKTDEVQCGDICAIVGLDDIEIGDTVADRENPEALPALTIDEPTLRMAFTINNSPYVGKDGGKFLTSRHLRDRLMLELETDVALRVKETEKGDTFWVSGRGILHLAVLIENMRREGYEVQVGQPEVIYHEVDGKTHEPIEECVIEVPEKSSGKVMELFGPRKGDLKEMEPRGSMMYLKYHIPSRGLIGLRTKVLNVSAGEAIMSHRFLEYGEFKGELIQRRNGAIVSGGTGQATAFSINNLQDRGSFFISPSDDCYEGQIIGEFNKDTELTVNVQKGKNLTNVRSSGTDEKARIAPAIRMSLEDALEYIGPNDYVEVTSKSVRLRKKILSEIERKKNKRSKK
ncbi:MAG: translational GTPase TypA [Planctomycetota bacterium]|nr:MAG: translational GTPase TypA [Planctomycetota bacterium]